MRVYSTYKTGTMTTLNDFTTCRTGTGRCFKKVCLAFFISTHFLSLILFVRSILDSNFQTNFFSFEYS